jgi:RimJ/RimL family protein N-acetyltransferase
MANLHPSISAGKALMSSITTSRMLLRPFSLADAEDVQRLAGDKRIADTTVNIPHPYSLELARLWIGSHAQLSTDSKALTFALVLTSTKTLIGAISLLNPNEVHSRSDLGYWIGANYWGNGFCTEAVQSLVAHSNQILGFTRFTAQCMASNVASSRVMQKCGLVHEGTLKRHLLKNGIYQDIDIYGLNFPERITKVIVQ